MLKPRWNRPPCRNAYDTSCHGAKPTWPLVAAALPNGHSASGISSAGKEALQQVGRDVGEKQDGGDRRHGTKMGIVRRAGKRNARLYRTDCMRRARPRATPGDAMRSERSPHGAPRAGTDARRRPRKRVTPRFDSKIPAPGAASRGARRRMACPLLPEEVPLRSSPPPVRAHRFPAPPARAPCRLRRGPMAPCTAHVAVRRDGRAAAAARQRVSCT